VSHFSRGAKLLMDGEEDSDFHKARDGSASAGGTACPEMDGRDSAISTHHRTRGVLRAAHRNHRSTLVYCLDERVCQIVRSQQLRLGWNGNEAIGMHVAERLTVCHFIRVGHVQVAMVATLSINVLFGSFSEGFAQAAS
jgi:hypothetical protein